MQLFNVLRQLFCTLCIAFALSSTALGAAAKPSILVVHSWHDILWDRLWQKALHDRLGQYYQLEHFYLDAMRSDEEQLKQNADAAWNRYRELAPQMVILGDDEALRMLGLRLADTVPVVFLGINNNPRKLIRSILPRNITGVMERPLYERALRHIAEVLPQGADRVLFLNDTDQNSSSVTNINTIFNGNTTTRVGKVTVELRVTNNWERWQQEVLSAKSAGFDAILFDSRYLIFDNRGRYVEPEPGVVRWMAQHSELPLFNFYEDSIGPGLSTGGWVLSGYGIGTYAAKIALDILRYGKQPQDIYPVYYDKGEYIFSRTQLSRWGLTLPLHIGQQASFAEDLYRLYEFDCSQYAESVCFD